MHTSSLQSFINSYPKKVNVKDQQWVDSRHFSFQKYSEYNMHVSQFSKMLMRITDTPTHDRQSLSTSSLSGNIRAFPIIKNQCLWMSSPKSGLNQYN